MLKTTPRGGAAAPDHKMSRQSSPTSPGSAHRKQLVVLFGIIIAIVTTIYIVVDIEVLSKLFAISEINEHPPNIITIQNPSDSHPHSQTHTHSHPQPQSKLSFLVSNNASDVNPSLSQSLSDQSITEYGSHKGDNEDSPTQHVILPSPDNLRGYPNALYPPPNATESDIFPYAWGSIYPHRVWCSVLTLWPERKHNIDAVADTWGRFCDTLVFVVDNATVVMNETVPDEYKGFRFLKLYMEGEQSQKSRNIWEKSWKTWHHIGRHHLNDAEWFLKIDDDTFFSAVNFKGFVRYLNPFQPYYLGHTLMHLWQSRNIVFNAGSCYAVSHESLRRLTPLFETQRFLQPSPARRKRGEACICLCIHRKGQFEDPNLGVCLHQLGIDPLNTVDDKFRDRFSPFRKDYHLKMKKGDWWYWKLKHESMQAKKDCCSPNMISWHYYKGEQSHKAYHTLNGVYNIAEGVNGKRFEVPSRPKRFLHTSNLTFKIDTYRNTRNPPYGMQIYLGNDSESLCVQCDKKNVRY